MKMIDNIEAFLAELVWPIFCFLVAIAILVPIAGALIILAWRFFLGLF